MTKEEFIKRFSAFCVSHDDVDKIGAELYDTLYTLLDGCVMPPTDSWLDELIVKLESL